MQLNVMTSKLKTVLNLPPSLTGICAFGFANSKYQSLKRQLQINWVLCIKVQPVGPVQTCEGLKGLSIFV